MKPLKIPNKRRVEAFTNKLAIDLSEGKQRLSRPEHIKIAAVQMHASHNLEESVKNIAVIGTSYYEKGKNEFTYRMFVE